MLKLYLINSIVVAVVVVVHYEALHQLSHWLPRLRIRYRFRVTMGLLGALVAHALEVWIFAIAYYIMILHGGFGALKTELEATLVNCAYFSFVTYSSLGYGDIIPEGDIRFLAGIEALTGLVLIAWTASFMYFEMQRYWQAD